jgi:hypothetical protein
LPDTSTLAGLIDDLDQELFVCSGPVLRDDHALVKTVATISGLTCHLAISSAYYSTYKVFAKKHNLPVFADLRCFSCASIDSDVQRRKPCWLCRPTDQDSNVESKECLAFLEC